MLIVQSGWVSIFEMRSKYLIVISLLLFSCQGGSITPGIGGTDKYISLVERMNEEVSLHQTMFQGIKESENFSDFTIKSIISIDQKDLNSAYITVPGLNIKASFNKTEIIKSILTGFDQNGTLTHVEVTFIFATNGEYYSQSQFPLEEVYYFIEWPELFADSGVLSVRYSNDEIILIADSKGQIKRIGSVLSFEYYGYEFNAYTKQFDFIGSVYGSGNIEAQKVGEFPQF